MFKKFKKYVIRNKYFFYLALSSMNAGGYCPYYAI